MEKPEAATAKTSALLATEHEMASEMKELKAKAEHWMGMDHGEKKAFEAWKTEMQIQRLHTGRMPRFASSFPAKRRSSLLPRWHTRRAISRRPRRSMTNGKQK